MTRWTLYAQRWHDLIADLPRTDDGNRLFRDIHQKIERYQSTEKVEIALTDHEQSLIGNARLWEARPGWE